MIVTRLSGGLGNQLFQYAVGRALAARHAVPLGLDKRFYLSHRMRRFALGDFGINEVPLGRVRLPLNRATKFGHHFREIFAPLSSFRLCKERKYSIEQVKALPDWSYLEGYFQSEQYFEDESEIVRRDLVMTSPATGRNRDLLRSIKAGPSVGIHVRRGDYVAKTGFEVKFGLCGLDYYRRGVDHIVERAGPDLEFYVFSDDPDWVRESLKLDHPMQVVDHNSTDAALEDMRLLSACRHAIIANSTFSWWAAWLNPDPNRIVVAPDPWFLKSYPSADVIVPARWVRLPSDLR